MDNRLSRRIRAIFLSRVEEVEAESCTIPKCRYSDCPQIISDGGTRRGGTFHGEMDRCVEKARADDDMQ